MSKRESKAMAPQSGILLGTMDSASMGLRYTWINDASLPGPQKIIKLPQQQKTPPLPPLTKRRIPLFGKRG